MDSSSEILTRIRSSMKVQGIDVVIIPSTDPHLGEYIPDYWKVIPWLTGFTGSAAIVVITDPFAGLWTDSRYFIQAEIQLINSGFELMKPTGIRSYDYVEWLGLNTKDGTIIAFDGRLFSITGFRELQKKLEGKKIEYINDSDLISELFTDRPQLPASRAWDHLVEYSGKERSSKIAEVREQMKMHDIDYHLLTSPEDIMWLLNIRGNDLIYSPLIFSFAIVGKEQIFLFVNENSFPASLSSDFDKLGIVMLPYDECAGMISALTDGSSILITPETTSVYLYNSIPDTYRIISDISIPASLKAIKNKTEIANITKVMVKDGVALSRFLYWIENDIGVVPMTERSLAMRLHEFRSKQEGYLGPSFATITAFGEHAALPHYSPTPDSDIEIEERGILLIDSGGQYLGGTTDITRTIAIGNPTIQQKKDFTLVLKGNINLALAKFPMGTKGYQLDILARKTLWENGLNYGHGTGHGVGYCLNVHEGPQTISPASNKTIIAPGMLISNEPAVYREGEYGIRIENLMISYEDEETEFGKFLKFDTVSFCYIDKILIDKSLLDQREINWLNSYHSEVYDKLSSYLTEEERVWLLNKTESI